MMKITFRADTRQIEAAFAEASANAQREMQRGIREAAKQIALPVVRQEVTGKLPGVTTAGATAKGGYVRQTHPGAAINEFGGTRRDVIRPINAKALSTPAGPRAKVGGARVYTAKHALQRAAERASPLMEKPMLDAMLTAYRNAGFEVSS